MSTAQAVAPTRQHLTLSGSSLLVRDFFCYSLQSILYQRALYPPEDFKAVRKYGLQMLVAIDDALSTYIEAAMRQLAEWLEKGAVSRVVVAIVDTETGDTVERWQFDVDVVGEAVAESKLAKEEKKPVPPKASAANSGTYGAKTDAHVKAEIAAIIKQITASCTFLPMLEQQCSFSILAYTSTSTPIPLEWAESSARLISEGEAEQVRLRSFSTHVHRVDAMVAYRRGEDE